MNERVSLAALSLIVSLGVACASPPLGPSTDQDRISLDEYRAGLEKWATARPAPVVTLPAGTTLKLRLAPTLDPSDSPRLKRIFKDALLQPSFDSPFEAVGDAELTLRVRETMQLDLERFLVSRDGKRWTPLGSHYLSMWGISTELTVTDEEQRRFAVPAWAFTDLTLVPPRRSNE